MKKIYKLTNVKRITFNHVIMVSVILCLAISQKVRSQTYGTPLFTEDFGTVPTGQDVNKYRGDITGRGTIGNTYWLWPYTCSGTGWMMQSTPVLETSYDLTLPASEQGVTIWNFVPVTVLTGAPYVGVNKNNPAYSWCLGNSTWTGPNPSSCTGTFVRWYNVCGVWKLGHWERYRLRTSSDCSSWHSIMDDGGYALSTNPRYVHSPNGADGTDIAWFDGPDHTTGDVNGMMLVVNAAMQKGLFYKRQITGLCYGAQFEFKSYYANILKSTACSGNGIAINIRYEIWNSDPGDDEANSLITVGGSACNGATLLAQTNTGDVAASSSLTWKTTSLIFNVPQNQDNVFIILRNNGPGGCGNDLAIDDITFSPYIPFTIGYTAVTTNYCSLGQIQLNANLTSGSIPSSIPYVFQWQVAPQGTSNWVNVGSPITSFSNASINLSLNDMSGKIYRIISAANVQNFNNSNCYVASGSFDVTSIVMPTGSITAVTDVCGTTSHTAKNATFTVNYQGNQFPWTFYYKINGGTEQSQSVSSPNTTYTKTISITDSTNVTLTKISTSSCVVSINSVNKIKYSTGSPASVTQITGPNPACIGTDAQFTATQVTGAVSYNWAVSGGWVVKSGQGTNVATLTIGSAATTIQVTTSNTCGTNVFSSGSFQTTNLSPSAPADITTPNGLCFPSSTTPGNTDVLFQASAVSGAQNYIWEWDSPVVLGTQQTGTTGQYLGKIVLSVPNNVTSFNVRVKTQNGCGYSSFKQKTFTPNRLLAIGKNITVNLDATGNVTITGAQVDNGSSSTCGIKTLSVSPNTFTCANIGANSVILTVTDNNNNVATCTPTVTVQDNIPPTIICPADIITNTDDHLFIASGVNLGVPITSDNCTIANATNDASTVYSIGITPVTWTVTDGSGNTATCVQKVNVTYIANPPITFPTGSYIINMGVFVNNKISDIKTQLKPYGMIYDLIKNYNIPIYWIISPIKVKDGADFTYNGINYKGGTFIIHKSYISTSVQARINYWTAQGVVGTTTTSSLTLNYTYKLTSVPLWTLDEDNGSIAESFFTNAGIPASAYNWVYPSDLSICNDVFVLPHANPTWATHANLIAWNLNYKGAIWAGCNAVSALESMFNPADKSQQGNFLSKKTGNYSGNGSYAENALIMSSHHNNATPPYTTTNPTALIFPVNYSPQLVSPSDPVAQFMGVSDLAHKNGAEQVYLPVKTGGWRSTTKIITYDPTQSNVPLTSNGPAAVIVYGHGFGDANRGSIMYEAGHNLNSGTTGDVPAQRAFFNWSMLASYDKLPVIASVSGIPSDGRFKSLPYPQNYSLSVFYLSPISAGFSSVTWTCTRSDNGTSFGTFSPNGTLAATNTVFTPSITNDIDVPCIITVKVVDQCGRVCFETYPVTVTPVPRAPIPATDFGFISATCAIQGYPAIVNVLNNDYDPDGDPITVSNVTGVYPADGTWSTNGTKVTFYPAHNFFGPTTATYTVCDNTPAGPPFFGPLCATSTIVVGVGLPDADGCYPGSVYGIAGNTQITLSNLMSQSGTGAVLTGTSLDDVEGTYITVNTDYLNLGTSTNNFLVLSTGKILRAKDQVNLTWSKSGNGTATISIQIGKSASGPWTDSQTFSLTPNGSGSSVSTVSVYTLPTGTSDITHIRINAGTYPSTNSSVAAWLDGVDFNYLSCIPVLPQAFTDNVDVYEDIPKVIDVIANDINPGNLPLTLTISSQPVHGIISINPNNTITYINNSGYPSSGNGTDVFTYLICNTQGLCSSASVNLTIIDDGCGAGQYRPIGTTTTTVTLQEGTANAVEDSYIDQNSTGTNNGTNTTWVIGRKPNKARRAVIRFNDLSAIPTNAIIQSAVFSMYETATSSQQSANLSLDFHSLNEVWTETGTTWLKRNSSTNWATAGGTYTSPAFLTNVVNNTKNTWKSFDITNMVQQWVKTTANGGVANNGFLIKQSVETTSDLYCTYASSEYGTSTYRPKLVITYTSPNACTTIPNRAPLANPDRVTTLSNKVDTIPVLANDADPDGNAITINSIIGPFTGGNAVVSGNNVIFTPNGVYTGESKFKYIVQDNGGLKDTAYVYVTITNAPPVANNDVVNVTSNTVNNAINVQANDVDPDGPNPLSTSIVINPNHGTASVSGTNIIYSPYPNYTGKDTLTYTVCEPPDPNLCTGEQVCSNALVIITVVNQPPVPVVDNYTIPPCFPYTMNLVANDIDPEQDILHIQTLSALSKPLAGVLTNNNDGTVTFYPSVGFIGVVSFTYKIIDNGNPYTISTTSATVTINVVNPVNTPPVAVDDSWEMPVNGDDEISVLDNDYDPENQVLTNPQITVNPVHGTAIVLPSGSIEYMPDYNYYGMDSLKYKIYDIILTDYLTCTSSIGLSDSAKLTIAVVKANNIATLNVATPPSGLAICKGYSPMATIIPGSGGGVGATDYYEYSINNGATWSPYTSGTLINTTGASTNILIRVRRSAGIFGLAVGPVTIVTWPVAAPVVSPTLSEALPENGKIICSGLSGTVIINPGSGGSYGAVDKYEISKDNGTTWVTYSSGVPISTTGASTSVMIRVSRTGGNYGCMATIPTTIVTWSIAPTPHVPTVTVMQPSCMVPTGRVVLGDLPLNTWTINPINFSGLTPNTIISNLETGTYTYTVIDNISGCISGPVSFVINEQPIPAYPVMVAGSTVQCGGTVTLTATGGTGDIIYWQGTTSGGTSTATPSATQTVSATGNYYFRSRSASGCWGEEGVGEVFIVNSGTPYTPIEQSVIESILTHGGMVNTGNAANWSNQNWVTIDANGQVVSTMGAPTDSTNVLIFKGLCVTPVVDVTNQGVCKSLTVGDGATVNLHEGNDLHIHGNFVNNGVFNVEQSSSKSGVVENIHVEGDFINEIGEFDAGHSKVIFDGTGSQKIDNRDYPFYNLEINKPGGKSGEVVLSEETTVNNTLSLTSGKLNLNNNTLIVNNNLPGAITRDAGYIYAETDPANLYNKVRWNIGNQLNVYTVPFGKSDTKYIPMNIDIKSNHMNTSGYLDFSTYGTLSDNFPLPSGVGHLGTDNLGGGLIVDRYWYFGHEQNARVPVEGFLTFTYLQEELDDIMEWDMIAERYNPQLDSVTGVWADIIYSLNQYSNYQNHGFCINTPITPGGNSGTFQTSYIDTNQFYNIWVLSSQAFPLPINLLSFDASCNAGKININWTTATETNNHYFTVERSTDGLSWQAIATVDGAYNSSTERYYSISDPNPTGTLSYYRLKQTDYNGKIKISSTVVVNCGADEGDGNVVIFPNPVNGFINIYIYSLKNKNAKISLYDALGKLIDEKSLNNIESDQTVFTMNISKSPDGVYFIRFTSDNFTHFERIIKRKN